MWREVLETLKAVLTLAGDVKQLQEDLIGQQEELKRLSIVVQRLAARMEASEKYRTTEQENTLLKVQVELNKFEKRVNAQIAQLPPSDKD